METIILGAGAGGLTLALRLALRGDHVTLVERAAEPGGLAAGFAVGDTTLDKFYHHLFRSDRAIISLLNEIQLGDDLIWGTPDTSVLVDGQTRTLNSVSSVLKFAPISPLDRVRMGAAIGFLKFWPHYRGSSGLASLSHLLRLLPPLKKLPPYQSLQDQTAATWMRHWMGKPAYDKVWGPQLRGKFGDHADEISMAWMWARLHYRTTQLGYLRGGFQRFYDRMAELIAALDGRLHFETTATRIHPVRGKQIRVETTAGDLTGERVISTLPTRVTLKLLPTLPTFQRRYEWGDAYGAHCLILALDRKLMERVYWLSICDPDYPFLALVEHTNFIPPEEYGGRHLIYLGNYLPMDHPLFQQSKEALLEAYLPAIKRINPAFALDWVQESWIFAAPYAQPIVTPAYHDHIPPHDMPIPGVYLANMFQVYPQDRGQNYAVDMANWLAEQLPR